MRSHIVWFVTAYCVIDESSTFNMRKETVWHSETWVHTCQCHNRTRVRVISEMTFSMFAYFTFAISHIYVFCYVISLQITTRPQEFACLMNAHATALNFARGWQHSSTRCRCCGQIRPSLPALPSNSCKQKYNNRFYSACLWWGAGGKKEDYYVIVQGYSKWLSGVSTTCHTQYTCDSSV
jgi:hypothetical protein